MIPYFNSVFDKVVACSRMEVRGLDRVGVGGVITGMNVKRRFISSVIELVHVNYNSINCVKKSKGGKKEGTRRSSKNRHANKCGKFCVEAYLNN